MRFRVAPLRQAAVFGATFLVVRVIYDTAFSGADGGGVLLLDLPTIELAAPFTGVRLLGPITTGGVAATAWSAMPFVAAILAFGVLNSLFDVRPWFVAASRSGPLRSSARALVIAWQTLPALAVALRCAARAAKLRGERTGSSVLVPVLSDSIERAVALAASLEVRGFAGSRLLDGSREVPVAVANAVLERPGWSLTVLATTLERGTLSVVTGPTGSGKSTFLDALSGLFQHADGGVQRGLIMVAGLPREAVAPRETAGFVGVVAQQVRSAFIGETVAEEIGFALTLRGAAPAAVAARVREVAELVKIEHLVDRPISALSAGEAELVAIAAALIDRPALLLIDEPLAELDAQTRPRIVEALATLAHEAGVCVLVAEHRVTWFAGAADRWLVIGGSQLSESDAPPAALAPGNHFRARGKHCSGAAAGGAGGTMFPSLAEMVPSRECREGVVVEAREVSVRYGDRAVLDHVSLSICAGELVALTGPNGVGKSSLLDALALPREPGRVFVRGRDVYRLRARERHSAVALVPQAIDDLFVTDSVAAECRRMDRRTRRGGSTLARFGELLGQDAHRLAATHPRDLSGGQRVCLAIAMQLAGEPAALLVDEPVRGLDRRARDEVAAALARAARNGTAVLFATHEQEFAAALAGRTVTLDAQGAQGAAQGAQSAQSAQSAQGAQGALAVDGRTGVRS